MKKQRREHAFGDLYELLEAHFPGLRTDRKAFNVQALARALSFSNETVYKALRETEPLKMNVAVRLLETSRENQDAKPLYWRELLPFLLPRFTEYYAPNDVDDLLG